MKRFKVIITLILILLFLTPTAFARPGGGGSGGGGSSGGGSGGGSSHSSSRPHSSSNSRAPMHPVAEAINTVLIAGTAFLIIGGKSIKRTYKVRKMEKHCRPILKELSKSDSKWKLKKINRDVRDTFYIMSEAWTKMDQNIAIDYSTENLYNTHQSKLQWMKIRNERNIIKMPKLLTSKVFQAATLSDNTDTILVYIRGFMIDYIETNGYITEGNKCIPTTYVEYWKFNYENGRWVLDEIIQPDSYNL